MKTAMIMAAGRGERLKPITDRLPKPLLEVKGKALLTHHIESLVKAGFDHVVVNHAWLGGQIRRYLGDGQAFGVQISFSPEPCGALETGGAIVQALPLLGNAPFICINGDIFTDFDLSRLWLPDNHLARLVLTANQVDLGHQGDFGLDDNGLINNNRRDFTYTGIACYDPILFDNLPLNRFSLTPLLRQRAQCGQVSGEVHTGVWHDIGSLARLQSLSKL